MDWVRVEGSRDGPHLVKSSGGESKIKKIKNKELLSADEAVFVCVKCVHVLILTLYTEHVVSRCVAQLQPHNTRLHHDVIVGIEVTYFDWKQKSFNKSEQGCNKHKFQYVLGFVPVSKL